MTPAPTSPSQLLAGETIFKINPVSELLIVAAASGVFVGIYDISISASLNTYPLPTSSSSQATFNVKLKIDVCYSTYFVDDHSLADMSYVVGRGQVPSTQSFAEFLDIVSENPASGKNCGERKYYLTSSLVNQDDLVVLDAKSRKIMVQPADFNAFIGTHTIYLHVELAQYPIMTPTIELVKPFKITVTSPCMSTTFVDVNKKAASEWLVYALENPAEYKKFVDYPDTASGGMSGLGMCGPRSYSGKLMCSLSSYFSGGNFFPYERTSWIQLHAENFKFSVFEKNPDPSLIPFFPLDCKLVLYVGLQDYPSFVP